MTSGKMKKVSALKLIDEILNFISHTHRTYILNPSPDVVRRAILGETRLTYVANVQ